MDTIRWGVIATGKIAHSFAADLAVTPGATLAAVGSRRLASAQEFARAYGDDATRAYDSYEQVAEDPDVDVIYVATPHVMHPDNVRTCFEAGKAVLCEKALALNARGRRGARCRGPATWRVLHGGHVDALQPDDPRRPGHGRHRRDRRRDSRVRRLRLRPRQAARASRLRPGARRQRAARHRRLSVDVRVAVPRRARGDRVDRHAVRPRHRPVLREPAVVRRWGDRDRVQHDARPDPEPRDGVGDPRQRRAAPPVPLPVGVHRHAGRPRRGAHDVRTSTSSARATCTRSRRCTDASARAGRSRRSCPSTTRCP